MSKILIFGNSGSGKSTLAQELCNKLRLAHLDLDTLAWEPVTPPQRMSLDSSDAKIKQFTASNDGWVIEGCYTDLLELVAPDSTEIIFLNLPIKYCINNARQRPWEPHKYESKEAQDANLEFLIEWIAQYKDRDDLFSFSSHQRFYDSYTGKKTTYTSNNR